MQAILSFFDSISANKANKGMPAQIFFESFSSDIEAFDSDWSNVYSKDDFNKVTLNIAGKKTSGDFSGYRSIGILPEGFRPSKAIPVKLLAARADAVSSTLSVIPGYVRNTGECVVAFPASSTFNVVFFGTEYSAAP